MPLDESRIVKLLTGYMTLYPDEMAALMPLYNAIGSHIREGGVCLHLDSCPRVAAGALVVDEHDRVLALWESHYSRWVLPRLLPHAADASLYDTAERAAKATTAIGDVYRPISVTGPVDVSFHRQRLGSEARLSYSFHFLFRSYSYELPQQGAHIQWREIGEVVPPRISHRLSTEYLTDSRWHRYSGLAV
ncbi:hypothetical protein AB0B15_17235 [Streptomyces sp. NPDC045456]|uniref:hypothetical protein n=1 Tax=Streptomyces sp. NPDC045456 TaxID=3155254 RepID=UPI0033E2149E